MVACLLLRRLMLSYSEILKRAYYITIQNPLLWLFGLFVVGGFNLNFLHFQNISLASVHKFTDVRMVVDFFQSNPEVLLAWSGSVLVFSVVFLLITNISRILLVLFVRRFLKKEKQPLEPKKIFQESFKSLQQVIAVSLLTTSLTVIVSAAFLLPTLFLGHTQIQAAVFVIGALILLPLIFAISSINIFTTFFIIVHKQHLAKAFNLATDFFVSKWTDILGLALVLMVVYTVCFFVGVSVISVIRGFFAIAADRVGEFHISLGSAIIFVLRLVSSLLFWLLLGILNVFINTALLLLFLKLITPLEAEQETLAKPAVVPSSA